MSAATGCPSGRSTTSERSSTRRAVMRSCRVTPWRRARAPRRRHWSPMSQLFGPNHCCASVRRSRPTTWPNGYNPGRRGAAGGGSSSSASQVFAGLVPLAQTTVYHASPRLHPTPAMFGTTIPTTTLRGEPAAPVLVTASERLAAAVPRAELVVVPESTTTRSTHGAPCVRCWLDSTQYGDVALPDHLPCRHLRSTHQCRTSGSRWSAPAVTPRHPGLQAPHR